MNNQKFKMHAKTMRTQVVISVALAFTSLIPTCMSAGRPQIINSYPVAINFDGLKSTSNNYRVLQLPNAQQISNSMGQPDSLGLLGRMSSPQMSYSRSSIPEPVSGVQRKRQLSQASVQPNHEFISWSETSTNYQKRTLSGETLPNADSNTDRNDDPPRDRSSSQKNDSTVSSDTQKLFMLRKKMIDSQGHTNVSIEDTNWKIAAGCLMSQYGSQFLRNKDVKCASSQVVLSISRMQRAGCKSCEAYFHCEGFSNALKRCKDNYDVRDTLNVMRECQGLTTGEQDSIEATRTPLQGSNCQRYLCGNRCNYNPLDGTCPRNNCYQIQTDENPRPYRLYMKDRRGRLTNVAFPAGSPMKNLTTEAAHLS